MKTLEISLIISLLVLGLSACNTTRGVGEDVEVAGEAVQELANDASEEIADEEQ